MERDRLTIIVPYRKRRRHLHEFAATIPSVLRGYSPTILIVEQMDDRPFNRGALLNIGFLHVKAQGWIAFHDIDMLPLNDSCDYSRPPNVCHLANSVQQFDYRLPYSNYFGGVLLLTPLPFLSVNGFSNRYWGWGCEDDDLFIRFWRTGQLVERRKGCFRSLPHARSSRQNTAQNRALLEAILQLSAVHPGGKYIDPRSFVHSIDGPFEPRDGSHLLSQHDGLSTVNFRLINIRPLRSHFGLDREISIDHQVIQVELLDPRSVPRQVVASLPLLQLDEPIRNP
jgi:N-terminal domain of galactosyltransferase/N-terminal region of glycosyl transferase group 7